MNSAKVLLEEKGCLYFLYSDSFRRFIYIHGTPDTEPMGEPMSHGCIRMRNADVLDLFDRITAGVAVNIIANPYDAA